MILLDEYERRARFVPGLWVVAPVAVLIVALGLKQDAVVSLVLGSLSALGGPVVLASYVRQRGREVEEELFSQWGGVPTTVRLRSSGLAETTPDRARLRKQLSHVLGIKFPSEESERSDPAAADAAYDRAVRELRGRTRNKKDFPLIFVENKNYGYERNMLGMRPVGIGISAACAVALAIASGLIGLWKPQSALDPTVGMVVIIALLIIWVIIPRADRVKRVANAYADRLFEAIPQLEKDPAAGKKSSRR